MKQFGKIVLGTATVIQILSARGNSKRELPASSIMTRRSSRRKPTSSIRLPNCMMAMLLFASISLLRTSPMARRLWLTSLQTTSIFSGLAMKLGLKSNCLCWKGTSPRKVSPSRKLSISISSSTPRNRFKKRIKLWIQWTPTKMLIMISE